VTSDEQTRAWVQRQLAAFPRLADHPEVARRLVALLGVRRQSKRVRRRKGGAGQP
jgi:hypothetical protein